MPALTVIVEDAWGEDVTFALDFVMEYQVNAEGAWRSCGLAPRYWNCSGTREGEGTKCARPPRHRGVGERDSHRVAHIMPDAPSYSVATS